MPEWKQTPATSNSGIEPPGVRLVSRVLLHISLGRPVDEASYNRVNQQCPCTSVDEIPTCISSYEFHSKDADVDVSFVCALRCAYQLFCYVNNQLVFLLIEKIDGIMVQECTRTSDTILKVQQIRYPRDIFCKLSPVCLTPVVCNPPAKQSNKD